MSDLHEMADCLRRIVGGAPEITLTDQTAAPKQPAQQPTYKLPDNLISDKPARHLLEDEARAREPLEASR
ncbi:hypothetical protein [Azotobacter beijerinckii]|uniref:Uncharacterized protein n=1 Tax=Azotobacter beijerinckii TaxID=170623 RepID=A0A1I4HS41_9GAMM|nr:hypothetical protein [Azotobacter beijerinckii]SFB63929.1 hypothetical protein SAMN04244571_04612 [Azotobacter beijerinckii]SFL44166.1 hypothetical protein SAMN04244574_04319 [Azotobacter beijerinckii]